MESGGTFVFMVPCSFSLLLSLSLSLLYISFFFITYIFLFFQQDRVVIIFFFLTKMAFGVYGTCGETLTILPHTWSFV